MKVLLENLLRKEDGRSVTKEDLQAVAQWLKIAERLAECQKCMGVKIRFALAERVSLERKICAKMRNFP